MRDFLHRFYPYQALRLMVQRGKRIWQHDTRSTGLAASVTASRLNLSASEETFNPIQARSQLVALFRALKQGIPPTFASPTSTTLLNGANSQRYDSVFTFRQSILQQQLGFNLEVAPSRIPDAGLGVFLRGYQKDSIVKPGSIVAMYPGTLYRPGEAIFFNSLSNRYILKCNDGIYVDGKAKGLSGSIFRSVNGRDNYPGITPTTDTTWAIDWTRNTRAHKMVDSQEKANNRKLTKEASSTNAEATGTCIIKNPLAVGQIVNNGTTLFPPNVRYQELDIRTRDCPLDLQEFLPNIWYSGDWHAHDHDHNEVDTKGEEAAVDWSTRSQSDLDHLRTVVLVTTRIVKEGEELYSTYIE